MHDLLVCLVLTLCLPTGWCLLNWFCPSWFLSATKKMSLPIMMPSTPSLNRSLLKVNRNQVQRRNQRQSDFLRCNNLTTLFSPALIWLNPSIFFASQVLVVFTSVQSGSWLRENCCPLLQIFQHETTNAPCVMVLIQKPSCAWFTLELIRFGQKSAFAENLPYNLNVENCYRQPNYLWEN